MEDTALELALAPRVDPDLRDHNISDVNSEYKGSRAGTSRGEEEFKTRMCSCRATMIMPV